MALTVSSAYAAMRFGAVPVKEVPDLPAPKTFLKATNNPLRRAMEAHNLLTEIPALENMSQSFDLMERNISVLNKMMKNLRKCGELTLGDNYKNPGVVLDKALDEYKEEVKKAEDEYKTEEDEDSIIPPSVYTQNQLQASKQKINRNVFRNIARNPKKYGGELINPRATKNQTLGDGNEESSMNILEAIVQSGSSLHNAELSRKDVLKTRQELTDQFRKNLEKIGLVYDDLDLMQRSSLVQVREDLIKLKEQSVKEAEEYVVRLNEQDAKYPELVAKRTYHSKSKQRTMDKVRAAFPDMMKDMVLVSQMTPQQQQTLIIDALKRDAKGTVYLTETNIVDLDRKMKEMDAHEDLIDYFKSVADEKIPANIPEFDFSQCKA